MLNSTDRSRAGTFPHASGLEPHLQTESGRRMSEWPRAEKTGRSLVTGARSELVLAGGAVAGGARQALPASCGRWRGGQWRGSAFWFYLDLWRVRGDRRWTLLLNTLLASPIRIKSSRLFPVSGTQKSRSGPGVCSERGGL